MKQKISCLKVLLWIFSFEIISFLIGIISRGDRDWYQELLKSTLTPPGYVFSIIWPILYIFLAIIGYILWPNTNRNKVLFTLFWIQMILNWVWSPIFFIYQFIEVALLILFLVVMLNGMILYKSRDIDIRIFYLNIPYFIWISFALYLNSVLFILN